MGARTSGREAALQMLFAVDTAGHSASRAIRDFWREFPGDAEGRSYGDHLVEQIVQHVATLDERIAQASTHWRLERMTPIDRNILRLGSYELMFEASVPRAVIIDEAVELAKRYSAETSGAFVNGVLNQIAELSARED